MTHGADWVGERARRVPPSPIRRMFEAAHRVPGAIGLAVSEPGFPTSPHIVEAGRQVLLDGFTRYSPNAGYRDLREAIADIAERLLFDHKVVVSPGEAFGPGSAGFLRLSYAASEDDLEEGLRRLDEGIRRAAGG